VLLLWRWSEGRSRLWRRGRRQSSTSYADGRWQKKAYGWCRAGHREWMPIVSFSLTPDLELGWREDRQARTHKISTVSNLLQKATRIFYAKHSVFEALPRVKSRSRFTKKASRTAMLYERSIPRGRREKNRNSIKQRGEKQQQKQTQLVSRQKASARAETQQQWRSKYPQRCATTWRQDD
jgi:hypothetical protein